MNNQHITIAEDKHHNTPSVDFDFEAVFKRLDSVTCFSGSLLVCGQETLDSEVYGRFSEMLEIAKDYCFHYLYQSGSNGCKYDPITNAGIRAMAVLLVLSDTGGNELKSIVDHLQIPNMTVERMRKLKSYYKARVRKGMTI